MAEALLVAFQMMPEGTSGRGNGRQRPSLLLLLLLLSLGVTLMMTFFFQDFVFQYGEFREEDREGEPRPVTSCANLRGRCTDASGKGRCLHSLGKLDCGTKQICCYRWKKSEKVKRENRERKKKSMKKVFGRKEAKYSVNNEGRAKLKRANKHQSEKSGDRLLKVEVKVSEKNGNSDKSSIEMNVDKGSGSKPKTRKRKKKNGERKKGKTMKKVTINALGKKGQKKSHPKSDVNPRKNNLKKKAGKTHKLRPRKPENENKRKVVTPGSEGKPRKKIKKKQTKRNKIKKKKSKKKKSKKKEIKKKQTKRNKIKKKKSKKMQTKRNKIKKKKSKKKQTKRNKIKKKKSKKKRKKKTKNVCTRTTPECKKVGGKCLSPKSRCLAKAIGGKCRNKDCVCCIEVCALSAKKKCRIQGGNCKEKCLAGEKLLKNGCRDGNCKCCVPDPCKIKKSCLKKSGICVNKREDCSSGNLFKKGCGGKNCFCCIKLRCKSSTKSKCIRHGGMCKQNCLPNERLIKNACKNGKCKCCISKGCSAKRSCREMNGFCVNQKEDCPQGNITRRGCRGKNCFCCFPLDLNGNCKSDLGPAMPMLTDQLNKSSELLDFLQTRLKSLLEISENISELIGKNLVKELLHLGKLVNQTLELTPVFQRFYKSYKTKSNCPLQHISNLLAELKSNYQRLSVLGSQLSDQNTTQITFPINNIMEIIKNISLYLRPIITICVEILVEVIVYITPTKVSVSLQPSLSTLTSSMSSLKETNTEVTRTPGINIFTTNISSNIIEVSSTEPNQEHVTSVDKFPAVSTRNTITRYFSSATPGSDINKSNINGIASVSTQDMITMASFMEAKTNPATSGHVSKQSMSSSSEILMSTQVSQSQTPSDTITSFLTPNTTKANSTHTTSRILNTSMQKFPTNAISTNGNFGVANTSKMKTLNSDNISTLNTGITTVQMVSTGSSLTSKGTTTIPKEEEIGNFNSNSTTVSTVKSVPSSTKTAAEPVFNITHTTKLDSPHTDEPSSISPSIIKDTSHIFSLNASTINMEETSKSVSPSYTGKIEISLPTNTSPYSTSRRSSTIPSTKKLTDSLIVHTRGTNTENVFTSGTVDYGTSVNDGTSLGLNSKTSLHKTTYAVTPFMNVATSVSTVKRTTPSHNTSKVYTNAKHSSSSTPLHGYDNSLSTKDANKLNSKTSTHGSRVETTLNASKTSQENMSLKSTKHGKTESIQSLNKDSTFSSGKFIYYTKTTKVLSNNTDVLLLNVSSTGNTKVSLTPLDKTKNSVYSTYNTSANTFHFTSQTPLIVDVSVNNSFVLTNHSTSNEKSTFKSSVASISQSPFPNSSDLSDETEDSSSISYKTSAKTFTFTTQSPTIENGSVNSSFLYTNLSPYTDNLNFNGSGASKTQPPSTDNTIFSSTIVPTTEEKYIVHTTLSNIFVFTTPPSFSNRSMDINSESTRKTSSSSIISASNSSLNAVGSLSTEHIVSNGTMMLATESLVSGSEIINKTFSPTASASTKKPSSTTSINEATVNDTSISITEAIFNNSITTASITNTPITETETVLKTQTTFENTSISQFTTPVNTNASTKSMLYVPLTTNGKENDTILQSTKATFSSFTTNRNLENRTDLITKEFLFSMNVSRNSPSTLTQNSKSATNNFSTNRIGLYTSTSPFSDFTTFKRKSSIATDTPSVTDNITKGISVSVGIPSTNMSNASNFSFPATKTSFNVTTIKRTSSPQSSTDFDSSLFNVAASSTNNNSNNSTLVSKTWSMMYSYSKLNTTPSLTKTSTTFDNPSYSIDSTTLMPSTSNSSVDTTINEHGLQTQLTNKSLTSTTTGVPIRNKTVQIISSELTPELSKTSRTVTSLVSSVNYSGTNSLVANVSEVTELSSNSGNLSFDTSVSVLSSSVDSSDNSASLSSLSLPYDNTSITEIETNSATHQETASRSVNSQHYYLSSTKAPSNSQTLIIYIIKTIIMYINETTTKPTITTSNGQG